MHEHCHVVYPPLGADLIPRSAVVGYPTIFGAMPEEDLYLLTARGRQLVRLLLPS